MKTYLTVAETAAKLKLHQDTVYRMIRDGELKAARFGRRWRIPVSAIEEAERRPEEVQTA